MHLQFKDHNMVLYIYGSYARNQYRPDSDVDVLAIVPANIHPQIKQEVSQFFLETGVLISLMILTPEAFEWQKSYSFLQKVLTEAKIVE